MITRCNVFRPAVFLTILFGLCMAARPSPVSALCPGDPEVKTFALTLGGAAIKEEVRVANQSGHEYHIRNLVIGKVSEATGRKDYPKAHVTVFRFCRSLSFEQITDEMISMGYRPATTEELVALDAVRASFKAGTVIMGLEAIVPTDSQFPNAKFLYGLEIGREISGVVRYPSDYDREISLSFSGIVGRPHEFWYAAVPNGSRGLSDF